MAVYNLVDCTGQTPEVLIDWQGASNLDETKSYIFSFATDICYIPDLVFNPDSFPQYDEADIVETYDDCSECNAICYRLIDCDGGADVLTSDDLSGYVGKTLKWQNDAEEEYCASVTSFVCRTETFTSTNVTVVECYEDCTECTAVAPVVSAPEFKSTKRKVTPNYEVGICRPEDHEKANCKFAELLFHEVASRRYGIEFCCDDDLSKWEIKSALMNMEVVQSRFDQDEFTTDPTLDGLEDCTGFGIGNMRINDDSCVVFRVTPIDEVLTE